MTKMKWIALVSLICFLFVGLSSLTACDTGISKEQRAYYLQLAEQYEEKAISAEKAADQHWWYYLYGKSKSYSKAQLEDFIFMSEHYADKAKEYRQIANHYRTLAEQ